MHLNTPNWLTICLHYNEPWEELIGKAIKPFVDVVLQTGIAEDFYFIRSRERGPHLQLNFRGNPEVFENVLKPNIEEYFNQYFLAKPSSFSESGGASVNFSALRHPNNSIRYETHTTLLHRFGGRLGLEISEKAFSAASRIANHLIREKSAAWTYDEMLRAAMKLQMSITYAAGMSISETSQFYRMLFEDWKLRVLKGNSNKIEKTNSTAPEHTFMQFYKTQHLGIVSFASAIFEQFRYIEDVESKEFLAWFHCMNQVSLELSLAIEIGKLQALRGKFFVLDGNECPACGIWSYLAEYAYFLNNNLGIQKQHEGYLFYLLDQSFRFILQNSEQQQRVAI